MRPERAEAWRAGHRPFAREATHGRPGRFGLFVRRWTFPLARLYVPRFAGLAALVAFLLAAAGYGVVKGNHVGTIVAAIKDVCDGAANVAGMRIAGVSLSGQRQVARDDIFAAAGVTGSASLLLLDVGEARAKLEAIPWIAEATVRKLYPDRLQITVAEREAFALWQLGGKVVVIAADGTVLAPVEKRFAALPFVVGPGAATRARSLLAVLDRHPGIRDQVRAAILVAERRWNLRLKNGIDVRLPETGIEQALTLLATLDREKSLLTRDIVAVDLRLADRVTVRLSETLAAQRAEALKKATKKKGSDA